MKFKSSRGRVTGITFENALYSGYASDGGILLPETIPVISKDDLKTWVGLSYKELAKRIVSLYVTEDDIPKQDLDDLINQAMKRFTHPDIAPIKKLSNGLAVMELFHGVSWAFKDLSLSCVGQFLQYFLAKRQKHLTVLTATSGDTGSAAIEAVRGMKWVDIIVLLPRGRISKIQELQMTTVLEDNVHVYRVNAPSDSLDEPIKKLFADEQCVKKHNICSINSINWVRIMVQLAHYFYAYLQMCPACDKEVEIVIPTGACGNVTAGCISRLMGLPLKLVCAVNKNNFVKRVIETGNCSLEEVHQTLAPAMDIQFAYNMERLWYLFSGDHQLVCTLMDEFEKTGKTQVPSDLKAKIESVICVFEASDETIKRTMRKCWDENKYLLCPHTSAAVAYHYHQLEQSSPEDQPLRVCIASASPAKFQESVTAAGLEFQCTEQVTRLQNMPTKYVDMEKDDNLFGAIQHKVEEITKAFISRNTAALY